MGDESERGREREGERGSEGSSAGLDVITAKCVGLRRRRDRPVTPRHHSSRALCQIAAPPPPPPPPPPRLLIIVKAGSRNAKISPHPEIYNVAPSYFTPYSVRQLRLRFRAR